ncbi:hypothetical protein [Anaeromyxobacter soli]|uniref:hypothetical protein n=1 Tax=Anaeromyxobacter soli TaxID=2922725 RepID=UPI001FAEF511|nr:hypothetical protein [Anaeromyxobacter sp. SG29]
MRDEKNDNNIIDLARPRTRRASAAVGESLGEDHELAEYVRDLTDGSSDGELGGGADYAGDIDYGDPASVLGNDRCYRVVGGIVAQTPVDTATRSAPDDPSILRGAEELLRDPTLLDRFVEDIHAAGVAGEDDNIRIVKLVAVSRLLDTPLAAVRSPPRADRVRDDDHQVPRRARARVPSSGDRYGRFQRAD